MITTPEPNKQSCIRTKEITTSDFSRLTIEYGYRYLPGNVNPYFTITGSYTSKPRGRYHKTNPDTAGAIHDIIKAHTDEFDDLIAMHLADAVTGLPMHAVENGYYAFCGRLYRDGFHNPTRAAGRYLNLSPVLFEGVETKQDFENVIDTLKPYFHRLAEGVRVKYKLTPLDDCQD